MIATSVPVKTPEGQAELSHRRLKLGQRQRTLLLLIDGKRSEAEVRRMAAAAGVPETCFDELCALGLIALPQPAAPAVPIASVAPSASIAPVEADVRAPAMAETAPLDAAVEPVAEAVDALVPVHEPAPALEGSLDLVLEAVEPSPAEAVPAGPISNGAPAVVASITGPSGAAGRDAVADAEVQALVDAPDVEALAMLLDRRSEERVPVAEAVAAAIAAVPQLDEGPDSAADESLLPAAQTLQPDVENSGWRDAVSLIRPSQMTDFEDSDPAFEEARELLVRAVRSAAPVAGSLTTMRLRRARSRADLIGLLGEVEARIVKPPRELAAQQTLRRVRLLLDVPHDSLLPVLGT